MTTVWRNGRKAGENCKYANRKQIRATLSVEKKKMGRVVRIRILSADLETQTAAVETGLVHGAVLLHKLAAQLPVLQGVELAVVVVVDEPLGQVQQGAQLTQGAAVGLHLAGVVVGPEEGAVVVGGDVAPLVDDVQEARLQDLESWRGRERTTKGFEDDGVSAPLSALTRIDQPAGLMRDHSKNTQVCQCIFALNLSELSMIY